MKTLKTPFSIFLFLLLVQFSFAEHSISGYVTSAEDKAPIPFVNVVLKGSANGTVTDTKGLYFIKTGTLQGTLVFSYPGYQTQEVAIHGREKINVVLKKEKTEILLEEETKEKRFQPLPYSGGPVRTLSREHSFFSVSDAIPHNTEEYDIINENVFHQTTRNPLSTFSIDVDAASYSNIRRVINSGSLPQKDMVRIEEMINYFQYDYPDPKGEHPFSITTEVSTAPWNEKHQLVHIGIQGKKVAYDDLKQSNLVFLIDVSGSMYDQNKLPLLKSSLKLLLDQLDEKDKIAIVVYAGAAGVVLPSTPASEKEKIIAALDGLQAGGSTAGGAGIKLAYDVALDNFIPDGNNRVILATDGDFNVGVSSTAELVRLIEEKRDEGIFLTITGFGMGNYKDGRMEQISNAGNGNYYYIDNIREAEKVFVKEMRGTLFTIAKDVKIQVEFNPAVVQAYRLIGYENRLLKDQDFNDDKKDAGELGAGHSVTALYEIIPIGVQSSFIKDIDPLKYQDNFPTNKVKKEEMLTVKFRYKDLNSDQSKLITETLPNKNIPINNTSENFRFSAAVANFGMILRNSEFLDKYDFNDVLTLAIGAKGEDEDGYRAEFIRMVQSGRLMWENGRKK